jgi:excisionase family DNA binding protein
MDANTPFETPPHLTGRATITVSEAAALLGMGRSATYEAVRRGEIPSLRFGGRILVPVAALLRLLGFDPPHANQ